MVSQGDELEAHVDGKRSLAARKDLPATQRFVTAFAPMSLPVFEIVQKAGRE